ncbi:hypothetical protein F4781DRAFT_176388 [Annulohypoxylon bovei var. microspora]|nr:hypothetical protein F4781DRAFT_176388 [Annulohypoxylon bovei var. microspora]
MKLFLLSCAGCLYKYAITILPDRHFITANNSSIYLHKKIPKDIPEDILKIQQLCVDNMATGSFDGNVPAYFIFPYAFLLYLALLLFVFTPDDIRTPKTVRFALELTLMFVIHVFLVYWLITFLVYLLE